MNKLLIVLVVLMGCNNVQESEPVKTAPDPVSADELAINEAVQEAYRVIEFDSNNPHDYERMDNIFIDKPVFMNFRFDTLEVMTLDDIKGMMNAMTASGEIKLFRENEIGGITENFGKVAHRISSYETFVNTLDQPVERGVNSFQLIKLDGKWLVSSIIWDVERESLPIPEKYMQ